MMLEDRGDVSQKRKAPSPSPAAEDAVGTKKPKLEEHRDDRHSPEPTGRHGDREERAEVHDSRGSAEDVEMRSPDAARPEVNVERRRRSGSRSSRGRSLSPRRDRSPDFRRERHYDRGTDRDRDRDRQRDRYYRASDRDRRMEREREREQALERERERDRTRVVSAEEKKRGQRLFGNLLGNLNQKPGGGVQKKRREEIERKQLEKARQRRLEDDKRRTEKRERLDRIRKAEQIEFDQRTMRIRHSAMIAQAHHLKTKSSPSIYYRPWELTRKQEDVVEQQVLEAEEAAATELREFELSKQQRLAALDPPSQPSSSKNDGTAGEPQTEAPENPSLAVSTNPSPPNHGPDKDHNDEMVVTEEETLIY